MLRSFLFSAPIKVLLVILLSSVFTSGVLSQVDQNQSLCLKTEQHLDWATFESQCEQELQNANDSEVIQMWHVLATEADKNKLNDISEDYDTKIANHPLLSSFNEIKYDHFKRQGKRSFVSQSLIEAEQWFLKTLDVAETLQNLDYISKSNNNLGVLYKRLGRYEQALKKYQKSLALKLELGDEKMIGNTLYNVGALLLELEREAEAVEYLDQSITAYLKYQKQLEPTAASSMNSQILHVYEDLVVANMRLGEAEKVELYIQFLKVHHTQLARNDELSARSADIVWGKYYLSIGKPELADSFISQAMTQKDNSNPLSVWREKVSVLMGLGKVDEAKILALEGLNVAQENDEYLYVAAFNQQLSDIEFEDDLAKSMQYFKAFHDAREELLAQKYNADIDQITDQIKSQKIERDLIEQQLVNSQKEQKISRLTNWILFSMCILIASFFMFANSYFKRQRERQHLLDSIEYHKQQWKVLNETVETQTVENQEKEKESEKQTFNELLVKTMVEAVDTWGRHTGQNRIDLAEKSKVWTVSIDNGTLRTRAMDKYLSLKLIPKNPRWRKVVRTCHFILADSSLNTADRERIDENLKTIMNML